MPFIRRSSCVIAVLFTGCEAAYEPQIGAPVYESERFEVWASDGLQACGGTFDHMERWLASFRELTGPLPTQERHRVYWATPDELDELDVCPFPGGCVRYGRTIYTEGIPADHETVHAEVNDVDNSFLSEGFAEAYGDSDAKFIGVGYPDPDLSVEDLMSDEQLDPAAYSNAGHFARFMVDQIGVQPYVAWMQESSREDGADELGSMLAAMTGDSMADLIAVYEEDYPSCSARGWRSSFAECDRPARAWESSTTWRFELDLACSTPTVVGPLFDYIWTVETLEIVEQQAYAIAFEDFGAGDATAVLLECEQGCGGPNTGNGNEYNLWPGDTLQVVLRPAKYFVRIVRPASSSGPVELGLSAI